MASSSFSAKLFFNSNCKQVLEQLRKGWRRSVNHSVNLVMELCAGGELFDRIIEKGHYAEHAAAVLCRQMVTVVHNCHSMGVMHRDLKYENFLLLSTAEDSPLKATDFGLSVFFKPEFWYWCIGKPSQVTTNIPPAASHHPQQSVQPPQQSNVQVASPLPGQIGLQDQTNASQAPNPVSKPNQPVMPVSSPSVPSSNIHSQPWPSHPLQSVQQPKGHFNAQATTMSLPQSTQMQNMPQPHLHSASQQHSLLQHPMSTISTHSAEGVRF